MELFRFGNAVIVSYNIRDSSEKEQVIIVPNRKKLIILNVLNMYAVTVTQCLLFIYNRF